MRAKSAYNNLVGRKVVIDWPSRWMGAKPEFHEQLKADAKAQDHLFGEEGEIVGFNPDEPSGKVLVIAVKCTNQLVYRDAGAVTIKSVSPREEDHKEVVDLLRQILDAIKANNNHG